MDTYKVVTSKQETEFIEADEVEENDNNGRLKLYAGGKLVGSFVGHSSFSIVQPVSVPGERQPGLD